MKVAIPSTAAVAALTILVAAAPTQAVPAQGRTGWYGLPTTMTLSVPPVYAGVPVTFTATLNNTVVSGSVSFWANGQQYGLAPSVPVVDGKATLTWTPGSTGPANWITFGADFTPNPQQGTTIAFAVAAPLIVLPNRGADQVSVTASRSTLVPGGTATVTSTAASGSTPLLSVSGPCTLATGSSVVTGTSPGSCVVTASTYGGGAYLAGSGSTTITVLRAPRMSTPQAAASAS